MRPVKEIIFNKRLNYAAHIYKLSETTKKAINGPPGHDYGLSLLARIETVHPACFFSLVSTADTDSLHRSTWEVSAFTRLMHSVIGNAHAELEYLLGSRAKRTVEGWLPLVDERAPFVFGRAPEPDDTIGMIRIEEGKVLPHTYTPMPSYRLVSSLGIFSLPPPLYKKLITELDRLDIPSQV